MNPSRLANCPEDAMKTSAADYPKPPAKQGLYDPQFEHDACGMGIVVNIDGKKDHRIVQQALTVLTNLTHRGARGSEPNSGDGAGIMIQIPHKFFL